MQTKIMMPKLGMEMTTGTVASWLIKEGDTVTKGAVVLQIETEKISYDIEAPVSGTLRQIFVYEGHVGRVGEVLGVITDTDEAWQRVESSQPGALAEMPAVDRAYPAPSESKSASPLAAGEARVIATPAARKLAKEKGIELKFVAGTSPGGRITEKDVLAAVEGDKNLLVTTSKSLAPGLGTTIPLSGMRRIIGERLTTSWISPHIYLVAEVDAEQIVKLRGELLPVMEGEIGRKLTYDDFLVKFIALAIEKFPLLNALIESDQIRIPAEINIGVAVALEDGLVVPVVRRANEKTLTEIVSRRSDLVDRARKHRLAVDELRGGTFSLSNLGMFEVDCFTAILNPPESGILSVGKIKETPVVVGGEIRVRPIMKLVLGVDHRVVDGAVAAAFLQSIKRMVENPRDCVPLK